MYYSGSSSGGSEYLMDAWQREYHSWPEMTKLTWQLNCTKERGRGQCTCSFLGVKTACAHQGLNSHLLPEHSTGLHFPNPLQFMVLTNGISTFQSATVTSRTRELRWGCLLCTFSLFSQPLTEKFIVENLEAIEDGRKMIEDSQILEGLHGIKPQPPPWLLLDKVYHLGLNQRKRTPYICRQYYCQAC